MTTKYRTSWRPPRIYSTNSTERKEDSKNSIARIEGGGSLRLGVSSDKPGGQKTPLVAVSAHHFYTLLVLAAHDTRLQQQLKPT